MRACAVRRTHAGLKETEKHYRDVGSNGVTETLILANKGLTAHNFYSDKFDTTAWNDHGANPRFIAEDERFARRAKLTARGSTVPGETMPLTPKPKTPISMAGCGVVQDPHPMVIPNYGARVESTARRNDIANDHGGSRHTLKHLQKVRRGVARRSFEHMKPDFGFMTRRRRRQDARRARPRAAAAASRGVLARCRGRRRAGSRLIRRVDSPVRSSRPRRRATRLTTDHPLPRPPALSVAQSRRCPRCATATSARRGSTSSRRRSRSTRGGASRSSPTSPSRTARSPPRRAACDRDGCRRVAPKRRRDGATTTIPA